MPSWAWRVAAVVLAGLCALAVPVAAESTPQRTRASHSSAEASVVAQLNAVRARHGLAPLRAHAKLAAAADSHTQAMARQGFFSHDSADGSPFWKRVRRFYGAGGYARWSVGENLLWASPDVAAARAVAMWMDSPPHRENLLSPRWREIGLSVRRVPTAPGTFDGLNVTIMAADFGARS